MDRRDRQPRGYGARQGRTPENSWSEAHRLCRLARGLRPRQRQLRLGEDRSRPAHQRGRAPALLLRSTPTPCSARPLFALGTSRRCKDAASATPKAWSCGWCGSRRHRHVGRRPPLLVWVGVRGGAVSSMSSEFEGRMSSCMGGPVSPTGWATPGSESPSAASAGLDSRPFSSTGTVSDDRFGSVRGAVGGYRRPR